MTPDRLRMACSKGVSISIPQWERGIERPSPNRRSPVYARERENGRLFNDDNNNFTGVQKRNTTRKERRRIYRYSSVVQKLVAVYLGGTHTTAHGIYNFSEITSETTDTPNTKPENNHGCRRTCRTKRKSFISDNTITYGRG